jgi:hypothetical protein
VRVVGRYMATVIACIAGLKLLQQAEICSEADGSPAHLTGRTDVFSATPKNLNHPHVHSDPRAANCVASAMTSRECCRIVSYTRPGDTLRAMREDMHHLSGA